MNENETVVTRREYNHKREQSIFNSTNELRQEEKPNKAERENGK